MLGEVSISGSRHLCLGKNKAMYEGAMIATMPIGMSVPRTDSLQVSDDTTSGQYHFENVQRGQHQESEFAKNPFTRVEQRKLFHYSNCPSLYEEDPTGVQRTSLKLNTIQYDRRKQTPLHRYYRLQACLFMLKYRLFTLGIIVNSQYPHSQSPQIFLNGLKSNLIQDFMRWIEVL